MWHMLTFAALISLTRAIYVQQGSKLVGTGATGQIEQGRIVALSYDGNTLASGGPWDNSDQGAVWVFARSSGTWSQQGSKLVGSGGVAAFLGNSVSLSSDGNTLASGGSNDNAQQGAVWVFTRSDGAWSQQGSKLVGTGAGGTEFGQGHSVSLSSDGNTLASGGNMDNSSQGAAWVFTRSSGTWSQQGSKLVGTGAVGSAVQGYSVSLSSDGNTLASGGPGDNSSQGAVWVFTRSSGTWSQQGSKLVGSGAVGSQVYQGNSVSLSSDGNILASGANYDDSGQGAVWIFQWILPTSSPSRSPTAPSQSPSTSLPSRSPSTSLPSRSPSASMPSKSPSHSPSHTPSQSPTPPTSFPTMFEPFMSMWPTTINTKLTLSQFAGIWFIITGVIAAIFSAIAFVIRRRYQTWTFLRRAQAQGTVVKLVATSETPINGATTTLNNVCVVDIKNDVDSRVYEENSTKLLVSTIPLNECCAVSWRWPAPNPDVDMDAAINSILEYARKLGFHYAWIDRACLPQRTFDIKMVVEASTVYDNLPVFLASLTESFDPEMTYLGRLWCNMELFRSLVVNPTSRGIVSIVPDETSLTKLCQLIQHVFHVIELGRGDPSSLHFAHCTYADIQRLVQHPETGPKILRLSEAHKHPHGALLTIDVKALGDKYRVGLAMYIRDDKLDCAKNEDLPIAAALLLKDEVLIQIARRTQLAFPHSRVPVFLVLCESGLALNTTETSDFIAEMRAVNTSAIAIGVTESSKLVIDVRGKLFVVAAENASIGLASTNQAIERLSQRVTQYRFGDVFAVKEVVRGRLVFFDKSADEEVGTKRRAVFVDAAHWPDDLFPVWVSDASLVDRFDELGVSVVVAGQHAQGTFPALAFDTSRTTFFNDAVATFLAYMLVGDHAPSVRSLLLGLPNSLTSVELEWLIDHLTKPSGAPFSMTSGLFSNLPKTARSIHSLNQSTYAKVLGQCLVVSEKFAKIQYLGEFVLEATLDSLKSETIQCLSQSLDVQPPESNLVKLKLALVSVFEQLSWTLRPEEVPVLMESKPVVTGVDQGVLVIRVGSVELCVRCVKKKRTLQESNEEQVIILRKYTGDRDNMLVSDDAAFIPLDKVLVEGYSIVTRSYHGVFIEGTWGGRTFNVKKR